MQEVYLEVSMELSWATRVHVHKVNKKMTLQLLVIVQYEKQIIMLAKIRPSYFDLHLYNAIKIASN